MRTSPASIHPPIDLKAKLRRLAVAHWRSTSSLIAEAVQLFGRQEAAHNAILRRLDQLEARIERTIREGAEIKEILLYFVRVWLEHNPPVDEDLEDSAIASAQQRFELFLGYVAENINSGLSVAPARAPAKRDDGNGATP